MDIINRKKQEGANHMNEEALLQERKKIGNVIKEQMKKQKKSVRETSEQIKKVEGSFSHPQLIRITNGQNYNIDTLDKVLKALNLEMHIVPKETKKVE